MRQIESHQTQNLPMKAHANRHAISLTGRLLIAGIRLERRLMRVPRNGFPWIDNPGPRAVSTLVVRPYERHVDPIRDEDS
jgi:hypothetical protein